MNTTRTSATGHRDVPESIIAWDHLEDAVDHLADVVDQILAGHDEQVICSLQFDEAEALAEVLDAGRHTRTAARLMHRWALTEPDWEDEQSVAIRHWLSLEAICAPTGT